MIKLKINLPPYRLWLNFRVHKRRSFSWKRAIKSSFRRIREIEPREVRLFIRWVFGHKNVKKILGTNLAFALIATSFVPSHISTEIEAQEPVVSETQTVFKTERAAQYPVNMVRITQGYQFFHPGIDLDGVTGDPIKPVKNGKVKEVSYSKFSYGNSIVVDHGNEVTSLYAHLSEIDVEPNEEVTTDTVIGKMGATGHAFGDHLHLEIHDHGRSINPVSVIPR